jgi:hypothetical protein
MRRQVGLDVTPHTLRRTCATLAGDLGHPPHVVSALLGHRSIGGTLHSGYNQSRHRSEVAVTLQAIADILDAIGEPSIRGTTGERPLGWYYRYGPSVRTRELLIEEGGFVYDSGVYNDDFPYYVDVGAKKQLVVPYSMTYSDAKFSLSPGVGSPADFPRQSQAGLRHALRRRRDASEDDVGWAASAPDRTGEPHSRAARVPRICGGEGWRLDHAAHRHRALAA